MCTILCVLSFVGEKYDRTHICKCMGYLQKNTEETVIIDATRKENWETEFRGGKEAFFFMSFECYSCACGLPHE